MTRAETGNYSFFFSLRVVIVKVMVSVREPIITITTQPLNFKP